MGRVDQDPGGRSDALIPREALPALRSPGTTNLLVDALESVAVPIAHAVPRAPSTSATPEQVELVIRLEALGRHMVEHNRRVLTGEPVDPMDWSELGTRLADAARECRQQVVIPSPDDAGIR